MGNGRYLYRLYALVPVVLLFLSCATSFDKRGQYHKVRSGESLWRIAAVYRVDVQKLAEFNNLLTPNQLTRGARIYIPKRKKKPGYKKLPFEGHLVVSAKTKKKQGKSKKGKRGARHAYSKPVKTYKGRFIWPVKKGRVSSKFGIRNGRRHDGLDISAPKGTPIKASDGGKAVFVGKMRGYGNIVLLRHRGEFFTAYAHNQKNLIKKGQVVKKGQVIAKVGRSGRATGNHVHFEIRNGQDARNPLFFLPERK